jgi:succinyl-diaminopimelate desuccinylase
LNGDIIFLAVAGEETDSCGAEKFIDNPGQLPELAGVIIPEPTDFSIVTAHRGMLWLKIATKGKTAHSSTPELGVNAIASMRRVLDVLENYEVPVEPHKQLGKCSMSINTISGGKAMNVVPDKCTIGIDFRTLPGQKAGDIIGEMKNILARVNQENQNFDAEVSMIRAVQPLETDCNCDFVRNFCQAVDINETKSVGFTTDGPCFTSLGAPILIFGPGKPELCHKPDEYIDISDVEKATGYYMNIISRFLG